MLFTTFTFGGVEFVQSLRSITPNDFDWAVAQGKEDIYTDCGSYRGTSPHYETTIYITPKKELRDFLQLIADAPHDHYEKSKDYAKQLLSVKEETVWVYFDLRGVKRDDAVRKEMIAKRMKEVVYQQILEQQIWNELNKYAHDINNWLLDNLNDKIEWLIKDHLVECVKSFDFEGQFTDTEKRIADLYAEYVQANQLLRETKNNVVLNQMLKLTEGVPTEYTEKIIKNLRDHNYFPLAYKTSSKDANQFQNNF